MSEIVDVAERTGTSSSTDPELSQEERIAWLRERGVLIDLREKQADRQENEKEDGQGSEDMETLCVVMVPADDSQPCEEVRVRIKRGRGGDQLLECLKWYVANCASDSLLYTALLLSPLFLINATLLMQCL